MKIISIRLGEDFDPEELDIVFVNDEPRKDNNEVIEV